MIEFVNLEDGRIFNGDKPYVFWFENGQSVNLNYVLKVCFISNYRLVNVHLESDVFALLDLTQQIPTLNNPDTGIAEVINARTYIDLDRLKTDTYNSYGEPYSNFYVHMIYIMACSKDAGEIHDTFTITTGNTVDEFEVAADFYADNEILKSNLENFDITIPESIQKALFDVDVHEEANDNITLNRKYKEILMNYWDTVANKGSYNSLQNSLAWFEWGDIVRLEDLWQRHHEGMKDYFLTKLNQDLDYDFIRQFLNNNKTTYIGLYMALNRIHRVDGDVVYNEELMPELENITTKWDMMDLSLKMTLLGNFYSTFFMPVHLDLIHSTLERWVFSYAMKVLHANRTNIYSEVVIGRPFDMVCDDRVTIRHHTNTVCSDTLFLSDQDVFGYEAVPRMEIDTNWAGSGEPLRYMRNGMYAVARFHTLPDTPMLACDAYDYITLQRLAWRNTDTGEGGLIISHTPIAPVLYRNVTGHDREGERASQYIYMLDFMLAFMNEGHHELTFEMYTTSGNMWARRCDLLVEDASHNIIDLYKVEQLDLADRLNISITTPDIKAHMDIWMDAFQMVHPDPDTQGWEVPGPLFPPTDGDGNYPHTDMGDIVYIPYKEHSMFVLPENGRPIGRMNHTVIINLPQYNGPVIPSHLIPPYYEIKTIGGTIHMPVITYYGYEPWPNDPIEWLNENIPEYIWVTNIIPYPPDPDDPEYDPWHIATTWRIVGICRYYDKAYITDINTAISIPQYDPSDPRTDYRDQDSIRSSVENINSNTNHSWTQDMRFQPFMHRLSVYDNSEPIDNDTLIYAVPNLKHSMRIDTVNWTFKNMTTGDTYDSILTRRKFYPDGDRFGDHDEELPYGGTGGWLIVPQDTDRLKPGYYNITVRYKKENIDMSHTVDSAFLISK